jgi:hypothetical protein
VPLNTSRLGRTALWLAIVLVGVGGVLAAIDTDWRDVVFAALVIALAALVLVTGQTRRQR